MNILLFGLPFAASFVPSIAIQDQSDLIVWAVMDVTVEGAMRAIFSILFGAGVFLFLANPKNSVKLHIRRMLTLLVIGLFDLFVLMWVGDILIAYALAGLLLTLCRSWRTSRLVSAGILITLVLTAQLVLAQLFLPAMQQAAVQAELKIEQGEKLSEEARRNLEEWNELSEFIAPTEQEVEEEIISRTTTTSAAFAWHYAKGIETLVSTIPSQMLWDALLMMLFGAALFKVGFLQGQFSLPFYEKVFVGAFLLGLAINLFEVAPGIHSNFDLFASNNFLKPTYHIGRLSVALGWIALVIWAAKRFSFGRFLIPVGRLSLTNYLLQSVFGLLIFTPFGLGLFADLSRTELYGLVLLIWILQIVFSTLWLKRFRMGPVEWLWRYATYPDKPQLR